MVCFGNMGYVCDFCGDQLSMVYCGSDAACLCFSCDRNIHSANALSIRHSRTLLCERCNSQPAFVRCAEERVALCQNCDWIGHGASTSNLIHKRQTINCYSGCPSLSELSSIWSFVPQPPQAGESCCQQELDVMRIAEDIERTSWDDIGNTISQNCTGGAQVNHDHNVDNGIGCGGSSSIPDLKSVPRVLDQQPGLTDSSLPKLFCTQTKCPGIFEDDVYEDFNMDAVDLNLDNYKDLFGAALNNSEELLENGAINSLFGTKDMPVVAEGSSVGLANSIQPACSNAASADSMMSNKTDPMLRFTATQAHSSLSFSSLTGESSAGDYQDCGASPMLLVGEPPWYPPCTETSFQSATRSNAVKRYKEKKKTRKFDKQVRYASRKATADVRKRVKGRFVKAGDAYDYDPLNQTRSC